ncbi:Tetratricopeptide-like helical domain [Cinara cedri]|uniref:Tetratricopeptide-like helical domain n=1 Tax=Cinara cedri TaxID=506608 RepID=A0A5E4MLX4_9HEMI|nr:Tetratricopeptide-like helical domain [Cinara cedri]
MPQGARQEIKEGKGQPAAVGKAHSLVSAIKNKSQEDSATGSSPSAQCCEKVLAISDDIDFRILFSKCQQNTLQPNLAYTNHLIAEDISPNSIHVLENKASVLLDNEEFEESLLTYLNGVKRRTQPPVFKMGVLKTFQIIDDSTNLKKNKYRKGCLGKTVLKLANRKNLENVVDLAKNLDHKGNYSFYLGRLAQDKRYFDKLLKSSRPKNPFYESEKKIQSNMRCMLNAMDVAENQLYKRKQLFVFKCEANKMRGDRLETQKNHNKTIKIMGHLQMAKYLNTLIQLILNNKLNEATQKTEILSNFMEKIHYKSNVIIDVVYRSFGVAQYLLFQDTNEWNEQKNHQRMLVFLGAAKDVSEMNMVIFIESIFGRYESNPKKTKRKLCKRVKKSKSLMEKLYLNFEIVKCNIQIGPEYLIESRNISAECFRWAQEINSHTWVTNILTVSGMIEFRLDSIAKCCNMINKAIEIAQNLQVPGVIKFLEKIVKLSSEIKIVEISPNAKIQTEILSFMPNIVTKMEAMFVFRRLDTMPIDRQMSLVPGVALKYNNAKYSPAQAAHKYLSIVPGSQQSRLGISDFMLRNKTKLIVNIDT